MREILFNKEALDVLDSITWYNGIYEPLMKLKEDLLQQTSNDNYFYFDDNLQAKYDSFNDSQFNIFWMILVLQFGDYGTSPRSGWLEMKNKDKIIEFIDKITITYQEENEFNDEVQK